MALYDTLPQTYLLPIHLFTGILLSQFWRPDIQHQDVSERFYFLSPPASSGSGVPGLGPA